MQIHIITNTDKETKFKCERMLHCLNLIVRALPSHSYVFFYISEYLYLFLENGKLIISISDQYKLSDLQKTIILASAKFSYETLVYFPRTSVLKDKTEQTRPSTTSTSKKSRVSKLTFQLQRTFEVGQESHGITELLLASFGSNVLHFRTDNRNTGPEHVHEVTGAARAPTSPINSIKW